MFCAYIDETDEDASASSSAPAALGSTSRSSVSGKSVLCSAPIGDCYSSTYTCTVSPAGVCTCAKGDEITSTPTVGPTLAPIEETLSPTEETPTVGNPTQTKTPTPGPSTQVRIPTAAPTTDLNWRTPVVITSIVFAAAGVTGLIAYVWFW